MREPEHQESERQGRCSRNHRASGSHQTLPRGIADREPRPPVSLEMHDVVDAVVDRDADGDACDDAGVGIERNCRPAHETETEQDWNCRRDEGLQADPPGAEQQKHDKRDEEHR